MILFTINTNSLRKDCRHFNNKYQSYQMKGHARLKKQQQRLGTSVKITQGGGATCRRKESWTEVGGWSEEGAVARAISNDRLKTGWNRRGIYGESGRRPPTNDGIYASREGSRDETQRLMWLIHIIYILLLAVTCVVKINCQKTKIHDMLYYNMQHVHIHAFHDEIPK